MSVKFKGAMNLAHINCRKEKAGEDAGPLAVDVKFSAEIGIKAVSKLFSTPSAFGILEGLYLKTGELITHDVRKLQLSGEAKDVKASILVEGTAHAIQFEGAKLNKITMEPKPGRTVDLSVRLQVHPTPEQHARLAELLGSTVILDASAAQLSLLDEPEEENEEEQEELEVE